MDFKNIIQLVVPICFLSFSIISCSSKDDTPNKEINLKNKISVFQDEDEETTLESILSPIYQQQFESFDKTVYNNPLSNKTHWFRFENPTNLDGNWVLTLNQPIIGDVKLYYKNPNNEWQHTTNKINQAWYERSIKHHLHSFEIPAFTPELYVRLDYRTTPISFKIESKSHFEKEKTKHLIILSLIIGFMLFVITYNLFLFSTTRRIEYLLYCMLITGYLLFTMTNTGFLLYLFTKSDLWLWFRWIPILLQPIGMTYTLTFLSVRNYPRVYKIGVFFIGYFISYWIWNIPISEIYVTLISQIHAVIGMFVMMSIGVYVGYKGNRLGYYFSFAYVLMLLFGSLDISYINFGKPNYIFNLSYVGIGFIFEVIILSYLLTKRFDWENKEIIKSREETQKKLLDATIEKEQIVKNQNLVLEEQVKQRTQELTKSLNELRIAQAQLIQAEKMASLGELTAGIAHEIQNPLNFVNNFSEVSAELVDEMNGEIDKQDYEEVKAIALDIKANLEKITHHGKRADAIVKGMLQHSRNKSDQKEKLNINTLCDEYLKLAYHGFRAKDKSFNTSMNTNFSHDIPNVELVRQDIGRVILNIITNAFHSVKQKSDLNPKDYVPTVTVSTGLNGNHINLSIADNGVGISESIKNKIFQPFFTTKPTGQGTGLGLSMSYDIIKMHGGTIEIDSKEGEGANFIISLPLNSQS